ncbi:hypothetical protein HDV57DRAFT_81275 [Trichoderma longibrachiatum]
MYQCTDIHVRYVEEEQPQQEQESIHVTFPRMRTLTSFVIPKVIQFLSCLLLSFSSSHLSISYIRGFFPHTAPFVNSKSPMIFTRQWRSRLDKGTATPVDQMPTCSYCSAAACRRLTALAPDTKVPANATPSAPSDQHWTKYLATSSRFCLAFSRLIGPPAYQLRACLCCVPYGSGQQASKAVNLRRPRHASLDTSMFSFTSFSRQRRALHVLESVISALPDSQHDSGHPLA